MIGYALVAVTVALTVYGQLIVKREVGNAGEFPGAWSARGDFVLDLLRNPWVLSMFAAAAVAAIAYMVALTYLELSRAYIMVSLSFVSVVVLSSVFFDEPLTAYKLVGVSLIAVGVIVGSRPDPG